MSSRLKSLIGMGAAVVLFGMAGSAEAADDCASVCSLYVPCSTWCEDSVGLVSTCGREGLECYGGGGGGYGPCGESHYWCNEVDNLLYFIEIIDTGTSCHEEWIPQGACHPEGQLSWRQRPAAQQLQSCSLSS